MSTTTTIEATTRQNHWQEPAKKGRIHVYPAVDHNYPTGPECADFNCESYTCRNAHGVHLLAVMGVDFTASHWGIDYLNDSGNFPRAEVDHKVWKRFRREAIAAERKLIERAVAEGSLPDGKVYFSSKAGCGCGCSPGFISDAAALWNQTVSIVETATT